MRQFNIHDLTIGSGASLSSSVELSKYEIPASLEIGSDWTAANITIKGGYTTFNDFYKDGAEYTISGVAASRTIQIPLPDLVGLKNIQFRSGTSASPVAQGGDRTLRLVTIEL